MLGRWRERGDTLIEVLFAVSVFSFVVVGALIIMNQGMAASQRAVEITLVRQQIDAQAETLRFMHDSYVAVYKPGIEFDTTDRDDSGGLKTSPAEEWYKLRQYVQQVNLGNDDYDNSACPVSPLTGSFVVDTRNARFVSSTDSLRPAGSSFAQVAYNDANDFVSAEGLWIRAISSRDSGDETQSNTSYIDFHIRACWDSSGLPVPLNLGTIVRLYEPRG